MRGSKGHSQKYFCFSFDKLHDLGTMRELATSVTKHKSRRVWRRQWELEGLVGCYFHGRTLGFSTAGSKLKSAEMYIFAFEYNKNSKSYTHNVVMTYSQCAYIVCDLYKCVYVHDVRVLCSDHNHDEPSMYLSYIHIMSNIYLNAFICKDSE